ncbi:hypothetical protein [Azomonas macrocytogenes]|uniref:Uncharacterized protein n=1 Tax=Azomonas macrocytogenes TaxID=69962 RepID=A0A839TB80_AZOMA|nr:hypothetical protein [Azomonas macrocytogenes]MBB3105384.1 hypothetical protein [Azomonas macrocytogenes]
MTYFSLLKTTGLAPTTYWVDVVDDSGTVLLDSLVRSGLGHGGLGSNGTESALKPGAGLQTSGEFGKITVLSVSYSP